MRNRRGRPRCMRFVGDIPRTDYFKPAGIPMARLEVVHVSVEELEAIRLVDYQGLEQERAAETMGISRRTLARDLKSGRKRIADALLNGKSIEIIKTEHAEIKKGGEK